MADKTWKRFERQVAAYLGTRRIPVAEDAQQRGLLGDIELPGVFVSCRLRANGSAESWWHEARAVSIKRGLRTMLVWRRPRSKPPLVLVSLYELLEIADLIRIQRTKIREAEEESDD